MKAQEDLQLVESNILLYETKCTDLNLQLKQSRTETKNMMESIKILENERKKIEGAQEAIRKQHEEETLQRIDMENRIQSLKEELSFKSEIYKLELSNRSNSKSHVSIEKNNIHYNIIPKNI